MEMVSMRPVLAGAAGVLLGNSETLHGADHSRGQKPSKRVPVRARLLKFQKNSGPQWTDTTQHRMPSCTAIPAWSKRPIRTAKT
jgi:hypothetical protein